MEQIVFVETPVSESPSEYGFYTVSCGGAFFGQKWFDYYNGGFKNKSISSWLKPVQLSTLIKSEWVSVEDRLPENSNPDYPQASDDVLVTDGKTVRIGYYENGWSDSKADEEFDDFEVIYWQPFPNPPKP